MSAIKLASREFSGRAEGPRLLITGGVHGDEFEPMAAIRQLIEIFDENPGFRGTLQLVPVVNEAAFLRGHRCAEDGLDLARSCPGKEDGSITERTAHAVSQLIKKADFYIDLHTGGTELAVWPLTGCHLNPDPALLEPQRRMARAFNLPFVWGTSPKFDGRTLSVARDYGVPAIYAEHGGSATLRPEGVEAYVRGCLNVMGELGMIDRKSPPCQIEHVVEDDRPDSGHMQVCNPSPMTGFFQPSVQLGQIVEKGQTLGTLTGILGDKALDYRTQEAGIVLVLRTFPRVRKGEALAVIASLKSS